MIKIISRNDISPRTQLILRICAVLIALLIAGVFMIIMGYDPIEVYSKIIKGAFNPSYRSRNPESDNAFFNAILSLKTNSSFIRTLNVAIPLTILSLSISVAFKMKFWNIGGEGQFLLGAFGASLVAFNLEGLPSYVIIPLMFLVGFILSGLFALLPAILKSKLGISETLVTLMMNYIAIYFIDYLATGPWQAPGAGAAKIRSFSKEAILPQVFGIHIGWIITIVIAVIVYILLKYTKLGYEIKVLGESENTARYAGMNVLKTTIIAILISGGIAGIAGVIQVSSGPTMSLSSSLTGGLGFTAVITTWLAKLSAPVIVITSFLFAALIRGCDSLKSSGISPYTAEIIQGLIIFLVLASEFFIQYKVVYKHKKAHKLNTLEPLKEEKISGNN